MKTKRSQVTALAVSTLLTGAMLVGCGGSDSASDAASVSADTQASQNPADAAGALVLAGATLLDVRDVAEFASGHLPGATNIPFNDGTLEASLSSLDKNARYVVYCRSGNRSSQAVALMKEAGFTDVTDIGGLDAAVVATGLQLVTE